MSSSDTPHKSVTLRHVVANHKKMIGIQFYPDKVIQAMIKELPHARWSKKNQMVIIPNNQENLTAILISSKEWPG